MRLFRLAPDPAEPRSPASLRFAMVYGCLSFGAVSTLAYSIWAFRLVPGTVGLYTTTALVYLGLGGLALSRLVAAPRAAAFHVVLRDGVSGLRRGLVCVLVRTAGKVSGRSLGSGGGTRGDDVVAATCFWSHDRFFPLFGSLLVLHSVGYYAGEQLYAAVRGIPGRLLWGAAHGLGFGAGLGYVLQRCQSHPGARAIGARPSASSERI